MENLILNTFFLTSQKTDFPLMVNYNELNCLKVVQKMVHIFVNNKLKKILKFKEEIRHIEYIKQVQLSILIITESESFYLYQ